MFSFSFSQQRYQSELETVRTQSTTSSSALQNAIDSALLSQRKEHMFEVQKLKDAHAQAIDDLNRRHQLREASERERMNIEKETWTGLMNSRMQKELLEKERQMKAQLMKEQQEEIELIVDKLTKENELSTKEIVRDYEKKIETMRR